MPIACVRTQLDKGARNNVRDNLRFQFAIAFERSVKQSLVLFQRRLLDKPRFDIRTTVSPLKQ